MESFKKKIISLYSADPLVGLFTRIRFWTGSYIEMERLVPSSGTILDLGCGYGIFSNFLALSKPNRHVLGIELDKQKLSHADKGIKNVTFRYADATRVKIPNLRAILLLDVLHHVGPYRAQDDLIKRCFSMLSSSGTLIIHEVDNSPFWKLPLARLADFLLYPGQSVHYRYRKDLTPLLQRYFGNGKVHVKPVKGPFPDRLYLCVKQ